MPRYSCTKCNSFHHDMFHRFCVTSPQIMRTLVRFVMHVMLSGPWAITIQRRQKWPDFTLILCKKLIFTDIGFWVHNTEKSNKKSLKTQKVTKKKWRALRTLMFSTALTMMNMLNFFYLAYRYQCSSFAFKFSLIFNMRFFFYLEKKEYFVTCITWKNVFLKW